MKPQQEKPFDLPKHQSFATGRERWRQQIQIDFGKYQICDFPENYRFRQMGIGESAGEISAAEIRAE